MPLDDFQGRYDQIIIESCNFTKIPAYSFEGLRTEYMTIQYNEMLEEIEANFMGSDPRTTRKLSINYNDYLTEFPFYHMASFSALHTFELVESGIMDIPADIQWPSSLNLINLNMNKGGN